jgi:hypothetical protein
MEQRVSKLRHNISASVKQTAFDKQLVRGRVHTHSFLVLVVTSILFLSKLKECSSRNYIQRAALTCMCVVVVLLHAKSINSLEKRLREQLCGANRAAAAA